MADRLMYRLQYRNFGTHESLVVNHTVDADGTDHAGVRWYEIRDPAIAVGISAGHLRSRHRPPVDGEHRDGRVGNIAGFNVSGTAMAPSIRYAARLATNPPGRHEPGRNELIIGSGHRRTSPAAGATTA